MQSELHHRVYLLQPAKHLIELISLWYICHKKYKSYSRSFLLNCCKAIALWCRKVDQGWWKRKHVISSYVIVKCFRIQNSDWWNRIMPVSKHSLVATAIYFHFLPSGITSYWSYLAHENGLNFRLFEWLPRFLMLNLCLLVLYCSNVKSAKWWRHRFVFRSMFEMYVKYPL